VKVEQGALAPATAYEISKLEATADQENLAERVIADGLTRQEAVDAVRERKVPPSRSRGPSTLEIRVSDAVTVTVRYRRGDKLTPVQALRLALKQAQAMEKRQENDAAA
jgi:hypothetical protein